MKEKKNRKFGVHLDQELALTINKLSEQLKISRGAVIRYCVDEQLKDPSYLQSLTWKKKPIQYHLVFEDGQIKKVIGISRQTGLSLAEIVRLCIVRQLKQIHRKGGIKLKSDLNAE